MQSGMPDAVIEKRDQWGNKFEFILSCLGYAVGLGNVWRFPYLCGRSGGAAFLVPYLIMMIFAGFPTFYMELSLGQYCGISPALLYKEMCPIFEGMGYTMILVTFLTFIYYNVIIAWSLYYFAMSFYGFFVGVPWAKCSPDFGNKYCFDFQEAANCNTSGLLYYDRQCVNVTGNPGLARNITTFWANANDSRQSPATQYLKYPLSPH